MFYNKGRYGLTTENHIYNFTGHDTASTMDCVDSRDVKFPEYKIRPTQLGKTSKTGKQMAFFYFRFCRSSVFFVYF